MSHKFKEVTYFLELTVRLNTKCSFFWKQILIISAHVGSRLIFFLSVVGNFLLILSVVSNIFRPLSLVGQPHSHPIIVVKRQKTLKPCSKNL